MDGKTLAGALGAVVVASACATTAIPSERLAQSTGLIRAAEEVGAEKVPSAALHLQLAREQSEQAKRLIREGANLRADYVLRRAQADAELALSLAKEAPLRADAQEAVDKLQEYKAQNAQ